MRFKYVGGQVFRVLECFFFGLKVFDGRVCGWSIWVCVGEEVGKIVDLMVGQGVLYMVCYLCCRFDYCFLIKD